MTGFAYPEKEALCATIGVEHHVSIPAGMITFRHGNRIGRCDIEELALMHRIRSGDFDVKQKLVTANLRLVLHSNRRYAKSGVGIFDLLKAGNRGLAHALESFEPESDGSFAEHAALCIRQHIEHVLYPDRHRPDAHVNTMHPERPFTPACNP